LAPFRSSDTLQVRDLFQIPEIQKGATISWTKSGEEATRRSDATRNEERILKAARRLLEQSPDASVSDIAAAAGVSRTTFYRRFPSRRDLLAALEKRPQDGSLPEAGEPLPPGQPGRRRSLALDAIHVFDAVSPTLLPQQLIAEAEEIAGVPVALYVLDIDGSHLLHMAGPDQLGRELRAPFAIGPELDAAGVAALRETVAEPHSVELYALWLRGRAVGIFFAFGQPKQPLTEMARQAAAAITLADRYTDVFARAQRRVQPRAAAEIQQSLLPPRIARLSGAEVAGNVLPAYEVAGDWFDVVENGESVWITLADGLRDSTRSAASGAVALGALRASRRSGASPGEALLVMHQTLRELPGSRTEMAAIICEWEPASGGLAIANCGHVAPVLLRESGERIPLRFPRSVGLGGRSTPRPQISAARLVRGDRLIVVSDGVVGREAGQGGLGERGMIDAACSSEAASAADTVRRIHQAVLASSEEDLRDDATAVCLAVG
jgi:serine phosphatase RsbU (regulator of sigma subunit)